MKLFKITQDGFAHWIPMIMFVVIFAFIGYRVLIASHAATPSSVVPPTQPLHKATPPASLLGALGPSASYNNLYASGFREVVIGASWANIEPSEGYYSSSAIDSLQS